MLAHRFGLSPSQMMTLLISGDCACAGTGAMLCQAITDNAHAITDKMILV
jgi:hypothetical protein